MVCAILWAMIITPILMMNSGVREIRLVTWENRTAVPINSVLRTSLCPYTWNLYEFKSQVRMCELKN